jgi:DNA-binding transcriptional MerR regulator
MRQQLSYCRDVADHARYAIGDLADLGGVSRRTVRYYVQEGLIPAPLGIGRGNHYGREHLEQLLKVKTLQEAGRTLDEIRHAQNPKARHLAARSEPEPLIDRSVWRRVTLAPGVELHVSGAVRLPSPGKLAELAAWCRLNAPGKPGENDDE